MTDTFTIEAEYLPDILADLPEQDEFQQPLDHAINDDVELGAILLKLHRARQRMDQAHFVAESHRSSARSIIAAADDAEERNTRGDRRMALYLEGLAVDYLKRQRADKGRKSIDTFSGRVSSRENPPEFVRDEEQLRAWLEATNPEFLNQTVETRVDWKGLKSSCRIVGGSLVDKAGRIVPVEVVEQPLSVKVETFEP